MHIDRAQFTKIVQAVHEGFAPKARETGAAPPAASAALTAPEAELIVALAQLAVAADRVEDRDEASLFATLAGFVYDLAKLATSPPTYAPLDDDEQRLDHMRNHAAQLRAKPSGALAYALAYILTIADLDAAPSEGAFLEALREELGLDEDQSDELIATVAALITPAE